MLYGAYTLCISLIAKMNFEKPCAQSSPLCRNEAQIEKQLCVVILTSTQHNGCYFYSQNLVNIFSLFPYILKFECPFFYCLAE